MWITKLGKLILKQNKLSEMPILLGMEQLTELDVSNNKIKSFEQEMFTPGCIPNIEVLNLSHNRLQIDSKRSFIALINSMNEWESLRVLDVSNNPIMRAEVWESDYRNWNLFVGIARRMPNLQKFCGKKISMIRSIISKQLQYGQVKYDRIVK